MNDLNAVLFALIGLILEVLPRFFPLHFPPTHGDQSSSGALWLEVMGAVNMAVAFAYAVHEHAIPAAARLAQQAQRQSREAEIVRAPGLPVR